ncbi:MAG: TonB-dependent siderophore receptor [Gammaproteobacteria bacterium]|nr:TonB-dependent siderophore receptor [Gammaproteobacteria bacterium]MBU2121158.1 TonB-dependent siderophore receptor [Gammaproteobacteria bacterium]MBU2170182.1 TonB-dependent siderophore receptor [Gammaproteobacteria bacterium]MBU2202743.1 TonB-dependent siderophore receptor [Gammaproteobacteria bacterium]MBU2276482.1 TonB-dependent siderophore receptor [Gammaproteobacteria bacterium]
MNHHRPLRTAIAQAVLLVAYGAAQAQTSTTDDAAAPAPSMRQVDVVDSTAGAAATPARRAQSSSRLGLSVLETPRSVSVIDNALLEQQMATTERDVLRNASGIATRSEYYGSYSQFSIRGLWANNTFNFLRDGAKFVHLMDPPLFNIERVEVIKGPAALEFGQVAPGGLVNYVSKRPLAEPLRTVKAGAGSHGWRSAEFDFTGPLNADGTLRYRLDGAASRGGSFVDGNTPRKQGVAGSLEWQITPDTRWRAQAEYQGIDGTSTSGLAVPDPKNPRSADVLPVGTFYGEPWLNTDGHLRFYSTELQHRFSDGLEGRVHLSRNETFRNVNIVSPMGPAADGSVPRGYWMAPRQNYTSDTALAELRAQLQTGPVKHTLLAGVDWRAIEGIYGARSTGTLGAVDLYNPVTGVVAPVASTGISRVSSDTRNTGVFLQDRLAMGDFALLLGLRHDRFKDAYTTPVTDLSQTQPSAALSWEVRPGSMVYTSYARSFQANSGTLLWGDRAAPPSEGKQLEVGWKEEWLNQRLLTTVSAFDLELSDAPATDPLHPGYSVLTARQRIKGVEFELQGRITPGWIVTAQASFQNPKVLADTTAGANVGNRVGLATRRTASLWTQYRVPQLPGLWLGGGLVHQGDKFTANDNLWRLPGFTTVDLAAGYQFAGGVRLQVNLKNVANRRYYLDGTASAAGFGAVTPGQPRSVQVSLDYSF